MKESTGPSRARQGRRGRTFARLALGRAFVGACTVALLAIPATAQADYAPPPNTPGFSYIFDGTQETFEDWEFASSTAAASIAQNQWTLDTEEGALNPNASPFGAIWYNVKPFGDATLKLKFLVQAGENVGPNGGVMIRSPEVRYTGETTDDVLAQKPDGYSFEVCPGALPICGRVEPAASETYFWEGKEGPYPPASDEGPGAPHLYDGPYCARASNSLTPTKQHNVLTFNSTTNFITTPGIANNHRHWTQVFCGHEIQINESLTGGGPNPTTDPRKTGSVYGFADLNAAQSRTHERLERGVWHDMEIRMLGQQYTILVDGVVINQFDNSVPRVATRGFDPPTTARQQPAGYIGFQSHGGIDRIWYKDVEVREYDAAEVPENIQNPKIAGLQQVGKKLTCTRGVWDAPGAQFSFDWYRSNDTSEHARFRAPSQNDLGIVTTPPDPGGLYGTADLSWLGSFHVGSGRHYVPTADDVGKIVHCQVSATKNHATVFANGVADEIQPMRAGPPQ
ncbi:MAG TPA: DUF1080 domain-containing protein [Gaiellaceae bacterium]|nr:DUF1080 domain-containing protein [Gaiellaceae bacterium]